MKELIQFLNEYQDERKSKFKFSSYDINGSAFIIEKNQRMVLGEETIINKKFGFIEWLVENNKVNRVKEVINDIEYYGYGQIENVDCYSQYDSLLMLLAIHDEPIEFLISILK